MTYAIGRFAKLLVQFQRTSVSCFDLIANFRVATFKKLMLAIVGEADFRVSIIP